MLELPIIPNYLEPCIANVFFQKVVLGELVVESVLAKLYAEVVLLCSWVYPVIYCSLMYYVLSKAFPF
jgi:hypothetical protein